MEAQSRRALELARWLEAHPGRSNASTTRPSLAPAACAGDGAAVGQRRRGGVVHRRARPRAAQRRRVPTPSRHRQHARVCSITTNLGDTKTTITHPASTSHGRLRRRPAPGRRHHAGFGPAGRGPGHVATSRSISGDGWRSGRKRQMTPAVKNQKAPFRTVADGFTGLFIPPGRIRSVLLGVFARRPAATSSCASRTPTSNAPRQGGRWTAISKAWPGWAWTTTRGRSTRCSAWTAIKGGARTWQAGPAPIPATCSVAEELDALREADGRRENHGTTARWRAGKQRPPRFQAWRQAGGALSNRRTAGVLDDQGERAHSSSPTASWTTHHRRTARRPTTSASWSTTGTRISHVIRGDDHVNNTPRQINILSCARRRTA